MRLSGITQESFVDGPGVRFVIFTQGCPHKCPNCHNPDSWKKNAGKEFSTRQIVRLLKKQKNTRRGVTFSGGEPFLQSAELLEVAKEAREIDMDVVTYTGFTYEQLLEEGDEDTKALLDASDILIDGKYLHECRDIALPFRGSTNQRVIDVKESRKCGRVVLWSA